MAQPNQRMTGKVEKAVDFSIDEDDVVTANSLNKHLGSIVQSLPPLLSKEVPTPPPESFNFPLISESQVFFKLKRLKRTSIIPVDIPVDLIKPFPDYLSGHLTLLFNQVTKTGEYPSIWKNGFITSIPKKDASNECLGVRPVFSKMYESSVAAWLKDSIMEKIDPRQFGNIPNTSTFHYLVSIIDSILQKPDGLDSWIYLIATDLRKAFDLICHNILVKKNFLD